MSDTSQGPGWWQASDDKWYPPEQHPDYSPPPPPPTPPPPPLQGTDPAQPGTGSFPAPQSLVQSPLPQPQPLQYQPAFGIVGTVRKPIVVILLSIVTLGIYNIYWQYAMFDEAKRYSGQGAGGIVGLLFALLLSIVNIFLLPAEIGNLYQREGQPQPITGMTGFWIFLPIAGWFVWLVKVQRRMNELWIAHGATPA